MKLHGQKLALICSVDGEQSADNFTASEPGWRREDWDWLVNGENIEPKDCIFRFRSDRFATYIYRKPKV